MADAVTEVLMSLPSPEEIAKKAGIPLRIAAKIDKADEVYFEREIKQRGEEQVLYNCLPFETAVEVPAGNAAAAGSAA